MGVSLRGAPAAAKVELTPEKKPAVVFVSFDPPVALPEVVLALTSRATGRVTISDVDVVWREDPLPRQIFLGDS